MPVLASSSRTNLRSAQEATFAAVAAATGRRKIRNTGSSLKFAKAFDKSKEIRADRQTADHIYLGDSASGSMNFELSYREYDAYMTAALQGTLLPFGTGAAVTIPSATFAVNSLTQTGGTSFATIEKGQWVKLSGMTTTHVANNRIIQASLSVAATATVLTFEGAPALVTGVAAGVCALSSSRVKNGVVQPSFNMEVEYADTALFQTFLGMTVNKMGLNFASKSIVTGNLDFMGAGALALSGASNLVGTDDVLFPGVFDVLNASSNVASILESNATLAAGTFVKSLAFDIDNALAVQDAIQSTIAVGIRSGTAMIGGKIGVYFANATMFNKFFTNSTSSISVQVSDVAGNGYVISLPAIEYVDAGLSVGSKDTDIVVDLSFSAKIDPISNSMITIDKFGV